ncbi:MAG TPA: hypothetical protein VFQ57_04870 [Sphingomonas sp.]|jgi:hypothetical protein|nr:hypothetical protein [Sphingomonas sp.]
MPERCLDRRFACVLFALVWFSCAWFGSWEWNANTATRMYAAVSLVEDGDATIDEYADLTIDKARFGSHTYLDKAPGMTLMALPSVALADAVGGDRAAFHPKVFGDPGLGRYLRLRTRIAVATGPALLTALAAVLLFDLAMALGAGARAALFASMGYALGTPIWGWSTTLFGHAPVAALYVIAAWAGLRATRGHARPGYAALAGAALGWSVVVEHQAILAGSAIGVWLCWRLWRLPGRWAAAGAFLLAGTAAGLPLLAYNLIAFGTPFRLGYQGVVGWEGMNQGLFGLTVPDIHVLLEIIAGPRRGLIWVAPVLAVAPVGLAALIRDRRTRDTGVMAAAVVAVVLLVNAAYVYWEGGNSTGPRLAMPLAGLLALGLATRWDTASAPGRIGLAVLLAISIALNAAIAAAEVFAPPAFRFPLWSAVLELRFLRGDLRTLPSEWMGWSAWAGFAGWALLAVPTAGWLARRTVHRPA